MLRRGLVFALVPWAVGCGGATHDTPMTGERNVDSGASSSDDAEVDAEPAPDASDDGSDATDAASTDAGFACGNATCGASQICVYPPCGCLRPIAPSDAAACADGSGMDCNQQPSCPPPPYCFTPSPQMSVSCVDEGDGGLAGTLTGPVPNDSTHACYTACI
jgi:hypothetical protein